MKLVQIYLDDETHTTLVKNYTIALAAAEESFTFEDYIACDCFDLSRRPPHSDTYNLICKL